MLERLNDVLLFAQHALELIVHDVVSVNPWLAALGTVLYIVHEVVRTRGWFTILRCAYPDSTELRSRDVTAAYLAGAGLNAIIPARGGDVVDFALVKRHVPEARWSTLVGTFVPETLFETLFGAALIAWGLARGFLPVPNQLGELPSFDVSFAIAHPVTTIVVVVVAVALVFGFVRLGQRRGRATADRFRQGLRVLGTPKRYLTGVVSWQALARLIRLASLAAFMGAFHLPVTLETTVLVMAAQGAGRIIPLGPASAGLRLAMLSYGFVEVTGQAVDIAEITAFTFGVGALLSITGLAISAVILAREFGTLSPRHVLAAARARFALPLVAPFQRISTGVPTGTRSKSAITSGTRMRMHPCEAAEPTVHGSFVPWMPTPEARPIQRATSGSPGPGGIV